MAQSLKSIINHGRLLQFKLQMKYADFKNVHHTTFINRSMYTDLKNQKIHNDTGSNISKSVFISQSDDIFTNLALEDWLYKHLDFTNHHVMLLWRNSPCVVVGRHQNPWLETNLAPILEQEVNIARRNSGGGCVYQDHGNLNLTFFTPREQYNRKQNLEIISNALHRDWGIKLEINKKEDLLVDNMYKVSGTASKLGRPNSYHHCTLLVDVNKNVLSEVLHKYEKGIQTNATRSVPSPVLNLTDVDSSISIERLISSIGWEYLRTSPISKQDGGWELVAKQRGFQMINPTDEWFPGLDNIRNEFQSWEWRFGRTPQFQVTRSFPVPKQIRTNGRMQQTQEEQLEITVTVSHGLVEDVMMKIPPTLMMSESFVKDMKMITSIRGHRFTEDALDQLDIISGNSVTLRESGKQFVTDCVRKVMASV